MNFNKKADGKLIKELVQLLLVAFIFIGLLLILIPNTQIYIDEDKTNAQLVNKNLLNNCFDNGYGSVQTSSYNQKTLDECLYGNSNILVKTSLNGKELYLNSNENEFNNKKRFCSLSSSSNQKCVTSHFPVKVYNSDNYEIKILTVQIITA